ncbi:MAG: hypothetical protein HQM12_22680 [SAR324 cluster bacterium]|nr:hypothetical protein [SAR324 cluster bacterium]
MSKTRKYQWIPTHLSEAEFNEFILSHLSAGSRGPSEKLSFYRILQFT